MYLYIDQSDSPRIPGTFAVIDWLRKASRSDSDTLMSDATNASSTVVRGQWRHTSSIHSNDTQVAQSEPMADLDWASFDSDSIAGQL